MFAAILTVDLQDRKANLSSSRLAAITTIRTKMGLKIFLISRFQKWSLPDSKRPTKFT